MKYKYRRSYRTRKKRSVFVIFKKKLFWLIFFVLIVLSGLAYLFIFSSVFQIKNIAVLGTEKTSAEKIRIIISNNAKNIFLADLKKINKMLLEKFPQIAKVDLDREFPSSLLAQIEERKPVAVLCNNECFFIDEQGVAFEKVYSIPSEMLLIKAQEINQEQVNQILKIDAGLKIPHEEILLVSEKRINIKTSEGWEIYFNPERDLEWQLTELSVLLKERIPLDKRRNIKYIDLRFDKVYIFPETYLQ